MDWIWSLYDLDTCTCAKAIKSGYKVISFGLKNIVASGKQNISNVIACRERESL